MVRLTYAKMFDIEQGEKEQGDIEQGERESPGKFPDRPAGKSLQVYYCWSLNYRGENDHK